MIQGIKISLVDSGFIIKMLAVIASHLFPHLVSTMLL